MGYKFGSPKSTSLLNRTWNENLISLHINSDAYTYSYVWYRIYIYVSWSVSSDIAFINFWEGKLRLSPSCFTSRFLNKYLCNSNIYTQTHTNYFILNIHITYWDMCEHMQLLCCVFFFLFRRFSICFVSIDAKIFVLLTKLNITNIIIEILLVFARIKRFKDSQIERIIFIWGAHISNE